MRGLAALGRAMALAMLCTTAPTMAANPKQKSEKMICKGQANSGTRFRTRICHTRTEWAQIEEENKRLMQEMTTRYINICRDSAAC